MDLGPELKEMFQRYHFSYHLSPMFYRDTDHILIGFHIEEAIYVPRYYGYGRKGKYGDRESMVRHIKAEIIERASDTVLILVKSRPEVIKERMRKYHHEQTVLREEDVDETVALFEEHYNNSLLRYRFVLDTSELTVGQTMEEFVVKIKPMLSDSDRLRIQTHSARLLGK